ncbi:hypothetical protein ACWF9G_32590 [Nocardia sp. NPDC055029]
MINNARDLNTWIRAHMPALDEDRFHPWNAGTPTSTSLIVLIHLRLETPFTADATTTIVLVAHPITTPGDKTETDVPQTDHRTPPLKGSRPLSSARRPTSRFRIPRVWQTLWFQPGP